MDAGGGIGLLQFLLADSGFNVINVDVSDREYPAHLRLIADFAVLAVEENRTHSYLAHVQREVKAGKNSLPRRIKKAAKLLNPEFLQVLFKSMFRPESKGLIEIYRADFTRLAALDEDSVDAVVSCSAIEHNSVEAAKMAVKEWERVVKPGGRILITTSAGEKDWYFDPAQGWCWSAATLAEIAGFSGDYSSNFQDYDNIFTLLQTNEYLPEHLSSYYFQSGNNGLPWGKWDPQYLPVGIRKDIS